MLDIIIVIDCDIGIPKFLIPKFITDCCTVILSNFVQPKNIVWPIFTTLSGIIIDVKLEQLLNAQISILDTKLGIIKVVILVQLLNEFSRICVTVWDKVIDNKLDSIIPKEKKVLFIAVCDIVIFDNLIQSVNI